MVRVLRALKIGRKEARYVTVFSLAFLALHGRLALSFNESPAGLTRHAVVFFVVTGIFALVVMVASAWLGFSRAGKRYSEFFLRYETEERGVIHAIKAIFAAGASAFAFFSSFCCRACDWRKRVSGEAV